MKKICFTGHRNIKITPEIKSKLSEVIEKFIKNGIIDFYAGGAVGWDMLCELTVLELKKNYPQIKLHLVLPCPAEQQTRGWNDSDKTAYAHILSSVDYEICSSSYYNGCMAKRNQRLVDLSDICVCYCRNFRSGSGQTIRMAERKGLEIINLAEEQ